MTVAGFGTIVHHLGVMIAKEKSKALAEPLPKRTSKPITTYIGGVEVILPPLPYRSSLPMARIKKVMRQFLLEKKLKSSGTGISGRTLLKHKAHARTA